MKLGDNDQPVGGNFWPTESRGLSLFRGQHRLLCDISKTFFLNEKVMFLKVGHSVL